MSLEALSVDPKLLEGHTVAARLFHDTPSLADTQPIFEATLDLAVQGPCTSDRMAGSKAEWYKGAAQVGLRKSVMIVQKPLLLLLNVSQHSICLLQPSTLQPSTALHCFVAAAGLPQICCSFESDLGSACCCNKVVISILQSSI